MHLNLKDNMFINFGCPGEVLGVKEERRLETTKEDNKSVSLLLNEETTLTYVVKSCEFTLDFNLSHSNRSEFFFFKILLNFASMQEFHIRERLYIYIYVR